MNNTGSTIQQIVELVTEEMSMLDDVAKRILGNRLLELVSCYNPKVSKFSASQSNMDPMTDKEAKQYMETVFPFGKYQGDRVGDIPLEYLEWLADQSRDTWKKIHRYLNSPRIKAVRNELSQDS